MPIVSMKDLRCNAQQHREKKEALRKKLRDLIAKDVAEELAKYQEIINSLESLVDDGSVISSDFRIESTILPVLKDSYLNLKNAFDNTNAHYNDPNTHEFRKLIVRSISQKKYSSLLDRIERL